MYPGDPGLEPVSEVSAVVVNHDVQFTQSVTAREPDQQPTSYEGFLDGD